MPESLRHTCAALLIAQGAHPKATQAHLGHTSITTTLDRYGHLFEDEHDKLAHRIDAAYAEVAAEPSLRNRSDDVARAVTRLDRLCTSPGAPQRQQLPSLSP